MLSAPLLTLAFFYVIGFLICFIAVRITFRIERNTRNQEATIFLLTKLWERQGVDARDVEEFKTRFKIK